MLRRRVVASVFIIVPFILFSLNSSQTVNDSIKSSSGGERKGVDVSPAAIAGWKPLGAFLLLSPRGPSRGFSQPMRTSSAAQVGERGRRSSVCLQAKSLCGDLLVWNKNIGPLFSWLLLYDKCGAEILRYFKAPAAKAVSVRTVTAPWRPVEHLQL